MEQNRKRSYVILTFTVLSSKDEQQRQHGHLISLHETAMWIPPEDNQMHGNG